MNNILDSIKDIQELNQHLNETLKSEYVMKKLTNKDKNLWKKNLKINSEFTWISFAIKQAPI